MDDFGELFDTVAAVTSALSVLGILLLLPLYRSQRRDLVRLREWSEREPDYARTDLEASEARLDGAEAELERLLGPGEGVTPTASMPAATRVTHERPALTRVTMERAALAPHPRWRRFVAVVTQPRVLVAVGIVALLIAAVSIVLSEELLSGGGDERTAKSGKVERGDVTVAVLNGTSIGGLAGQVGSEIEQNGYQLGPVTTTTPDFDRTVVFYANGQRAAAQKVSRDLGLEPKDVEPMDREAKLLADGADVVVIAGEDRAQP